MSDRVSHFLAALKEIGWQERYASDVYVGPSDKLRPSAESYDILIDADGIRVQNRSQAQNTPIASFDELDDALDFSYWIMLVDMERIPRLNQIVDTTRFLHVPEGWERSKAVLIAALNESGSYTDQLGLDSEWPEKQQKNSILLRQEHAEGGTIYGVYTPIREQINQIAVFHRQHDARQFTYCKLTGQSTFDSPQRGAR